jgi:multiple sugar transport system substrate-binding protein
LLIILHFLICFPKKTTNLPQKITVWGVIDDDEIMTKVIEGYKKLHPGVEVVYSKQTLDNYRTRVQTQVAQGQAADVIAMHSTWLPMFLQTHSIQPAPSSVISVDDVSKTFYPVVKDTMTTGGSVYALPGNVDGLALYYNKDILSAQGLSVPTRWDELVTDSLKVTVYDSNNTVMRTAGAPLGGIDNFPYWSETIGLLFLQQPEASIYTPANPRGREVFQFYQNPTSDSSKKIWEKGFPGAVQAFSDGTLAFLFAPASIAPEIKKKNPDLKFAVAPMPQLPSATVNFSCFWGYAVSARAGNKDLAWDFVKFLTDMETEKYVYEQQVQKFGFGLPYSRMDLKDQIINDPVTGAFVSEASSFKSFPLCSDSKDNGLNDNMISAFKQTLTPGGQIEQLQPQVGQILSKYGASIPRQ